VPRIAALLQEVRFYVRLQQIDDQLAAEARVAGCRCGGRLHSARYPRKPRGGPGEIAAAFRSRHSFCCAREGCRRRVTPPSVRFFGRRVFFGPVFVVTSGLRGALSVLQWKRLREQVGVSLRTLKRWAAWWQRDFPGSRFWKAAQGLLAPPAPATSRLPGSLWARFTGDEEKQLVATLRFLAPATTKTATVNWLFEG
jgi:hypothetical protein